MGAVARRALTRVLYTSRVEARAELGERSRAVLRQLRKAHGRRVACTCCPRASAVGLGEVQVIRPLISLDALIREGRLASCLVSSSLSATNRPAVRRGCFAVRLADRAVADVTRCPGDVSCRQAFADASTRHVGAAGIFSAVAVSGGAVVHISAASEDKLAAMGRAGGRGYTQAVTACPALLAEVSIPARTEAGWEEIASSRAGCLRAGSDPAGVFRAVGASSGHCSGATRTETEAVNGSVAVKAGSSNFLADNSLCGVGHSDATGCNAAGGRTTGCRAHIREAATQREARAGTRCPRVVGRAPGRAGEGVGKNCSAVARVAAPDGNRCGRRASAR